MKQLSKMMLAAVASVAFAATTFAWDFVQADRQQQALTRQALRPARTPLIL